METKGLVIVAVGLPGAGKSRFHEKFLPDAVRCCQDLLKRREKVEALVEETVRAGKVAYARRSVEINDIVSMTPHCAGRSTFDFHTGGSYRSRPEAAVALGEDREALQRRGRRVTVHRERLHVYRARQGPRLQR